MKPGFSITRALIYQLSYLLLLALQLTGCMSTEERAQVEALLRPPAQDRAAGLAADGIWPQGQQLMWAGYSGQAARDLRNGFNVAGPQYGARNEQQLTACAEAKIPVIAHISPFPGNVNGSWEVAAKLSQAEVYERVSEHVKRLTSHPTIIMWAIIPEELRPWRKDEMEYLQVVIAAIRAHDPKQRPIFLYNPNHRDTQSLAPIARHLDVIGKGCYTNLAGHQDNRAWVRWSVEQVAAAAAAGRAGSWPIVMPELCKDPAPADRALIPTWVKHDCYLGLMSGAKGMLLWSLHPRSEVKETWKQWYDAYAGLGKELNRPDGLGKVFLFGEARDDLKVTTVEKRMPFPLGKSARTALEDTTTLPREGTKGMLHPWTKTEYQLGSTRYVFLANSIPEATTFQIAGLPSGGLALQDIFSGSEIELPRSGQPLELKLNPWEVRALRLTGR